MVQLFLFWKQWARGWREEEEGKKPLELVHDFFEQNRAKWAWRFFFFMVCGLLFFSLSFFLLLFTSSTAIAAAFSASLENETRSGTAAFLAARDAEPGRESGTKQESVVRKAVMAIAKITTKLWKYT